MTKRNICLMSGITIAASLSAATMAKAEPQDDLKAQISALTNQLKTLEAQQVQLQHQIDAAAQADAKDKAEAKEKAAAAPAAKTASTPPGTFLIPGTNTTMKIGGYVKLDASEDLSGAGLNGSAVDLQAIPIKGTAQAKRKNNLSLSARQSRLNVGTETPTEYGPLKTFVEGDFYGANGNALETNSSAFRLRQAYGSMGSVLAGQTWSVFDDIETAPETLDFGSPAGVAYGIRQAQVRYTTKIGQTDTLAVSVENPESDFFGADHGTNTNGGASLSSRVLNQVPDFAARYVHKESWGRFALSGVVRQINLDTGGTSQTFEGPSGTFSYKGSASTWAGGLMGTAQFPTIGKDTLTFSGGGGPGIGRYLSQTQDAAYTTGQAPNGLTNTNPGSGAALSPDGELHAITAYGANVWYRHYWSDTWRSNITAGYTHFNNPRSAMPINVTEDLASLHVNLIWSPIPQTNFGIEYIHGYIGLNGQTASYEALGYGDHGTLNRIQLSAQYLF